MQVRQLLNDDDAVSPVIGVILMVAITVILAAVIASFVLGLGSTQSVTPTVSFGTNFAGNGNGAGDLTITHESGDTVLASEIYIRGSNGSSGGFVDNWNEPWISFVNGTNPYGPGLTGLTNPISYPNGTGSASGSISGSQAIVAGNSITFPVGSDAEISVVFSPADSDTTATLAEWSGPDA
ncbi:MAG: type IV pilin [Halorientalis sp.]